MSIAHSVRAGEPFLGLTLRDSPHGAVVSWIFPGPLGGTGFESGIGLRRGDLLLSLAGRTISSVERFDEVLAELAVGEAVEISIRRAPDAVAGGAIPNPGSVDDPAAQTITFTARVGSSDRWRGTLGRSAGEILQRTPPPVGAYEERLSAAAQRFGVAEAPGGLTALREHLAARQQRDLDPNSLSAVVDSFLHPFRTDSIARALSERARQTTTGEPSEAIQSVLALIAAVLEPKQPVQTTRWGSGEADPFAPILADLSPELVLDAKTLARQMRDSVRLDQRDAEGQIRVIRESPALVERAMAKCLDELPQRHAWLEAIGAEQGNNAPLDRAALPPQVQAAVLGDVLHFELDAEDRVVLVVGGAGRNEYRMDRIAFVYDIGGDDSYRFRTPGPHRQIIIDIAGNDLYVGIGGFCGPGTGVFGYSLVDDRGGNDVYRSDALLTIGAGLFGLGVIVDGGGDDLYENLGPKSGWSMGVGFYGAGVIVSRGGNDSFIGERLVQGVGGPRGFGAIVNAAGNDLYRADGGNFPSVYATPGVNATFGQGFGYGVRHYAAGGVGAIFDFDGNDRYEGGEFAQAGGYFWGMGIIHDAAGNDLYRGNRYGQAFAAHQAVGVLLDDGGDDTFWSMTAASQSGAWDESITMLVARGGHNTFRCDGLGQGAAAHQSIAILVADGGVNQFSAGRSATQGESSTNEYHFEKTGLHSFSALLDLGTSRFSSSRLEAGPIGRRNEADPARSRLYGLYVRD